MAKQGRKVTDVQAKVVESEFKDAMPVNVLRVPRVSKANEWLVSSRGSKLLDTLCYPTTVAVGYVKRDKDDFKVWQFTIDGKPVDIAGAKAAAIGVGCITDTTVHISYMLTNRDETDAIGQETKRIILNRSKRRSVLTRMNRICKTLESMVKAQDLGSVFSATEQSELYSKPAVLLNKFKETLTKVAGKRGERSEYFALS